MNMLVHLWYLAEFVLKWEIVQMKIVKKMKTNFMLSNLFFFFENNVS
jgi:hypothetical protein